MERGDDLPTLPELADIAVMCGVGPLDLLPDNPFARHLRPLDEPPALPRAPSLDPSIRVFATGPETTRDEYHPEDGDETLEVDERLKQIDDVIEASAGLDVINTAAEVGRTLRTLAGNARELRAALVTLSEPRSIRLWHPGNQREMAAALGEVTRKLHNYVAAAATLRDHAHRFVDRHYPAGSEDRGTWDAQTNAYFGAPDRVLVTQLRNYSLHRALPVLRAVHGDRARGGAATFIVLDRADLLKGDKWAAPVRQWLEQRELIDLAEMLSGHWEAVQGFYEWFEGWILTTQATALAELKNLQDQREATFDEINPGLREMLDYMDARKRGEFPKQPPSVRAALRASKAREKREAR